MLYHGWAMLEHTTLKRFSMLPRMVPVLSVHARQPLMRSLGWAQVELALPAPWRNSIWLVTYLLTKLFLLSASCALQKMRKYAELPLNPFCNCCLLTEFRLPY